MSRHGVWVLLAFAVFACQDGQSGSENNDPKMPLPGPEPIPPGIPGRGHCPCGSTGGVPPLRARVVAAEPLPDFGETRYRLVAEELFGEIEGVRVGDELGGYASDGLPCAGQESIAVGDEVLAFYLRGRQDSDSCCEYVACATECHALVTPEGEDDGREQCVQECRNETAAACAVHADEARLRGTLTLALWGERIVVGRSGSVVAEIDADDVPALALPFEECSAALEDLYPLLQASDASEPPPAPGPAPTPAPTPAPAPTEPGGAPEPPAPTPPATTPPPSVPPPGAATPPVNPGGPKAPPPLAHPEEVRVRCAMP